MLKGKKILVTGGSHLAEEIKKYTEREGIIFATTGLTHNPLMDVADEVYGIDTQDADAMTELVQRIKADGIFAGGNEPNIRTAIEVSARLGLPYYCNKEQWDILMNKDCFKRLCTSFNVQTAPEVIIDSKVSIENNIIEFPVVVKPVDACASKGVVYCTNYDQLRAGIKEALVFSEHKRVVIEKYIVGEEISATYTICHGKATLSSLKEKYPIAEQEEIKGLPSVYIYPSRYLNQFLESTNANLVKMIESLHLCDGCLFIQCIANTEGIFAFEAGLRPEGTNDFVYTDRINGVNHVHILIEQSLNGKVSEDFSEKDDPSFGSISCCTFTLCSKGGSIHKITGLDKVNKLEQIIKIEQFYNEGDNVPHGITLAQRVLRFYMVVKDRNEASKLINQIQNNVAVTDKNGESILFNSFDTNRLF